MNTLRLLSGLAWIALLLIDLILLRRIVAADLQWPSAETAMLLGLILGQSVLISHWLGCGTSNPVVRVFVTLCAMGFAAIASSLIAEGQWSLWFAGLCMLVLIGALISRSIVLAWYRYVLPEDVPLTEPDVRREGDNGFAEYRFSLWQLMSWVTAWALVFAVARHFELSLAFTGKAVAFFGCVAGAGTAALLVTLRFRQPVGIVAVTAIGLVSFLWFGWLHQGSGESGPLVVMIAAEIVAVFLYATILKVGGLRIARRLQGQRVENSSLEFAIQGVQIEEADS